MNHGEKIFHRVVLPAGPATHENAQLEMSILPSGLIIHGWKLAIIIAGCDQDYATLVAPL